MDIHSAEATGRGNKSRKGKNKAQDQAMALYAKHSC